jgi:hypothetical protein
VQKLPEKSARQWMHVFNSAFERCTTEKMGNCDAFAARNAWGVVHKSLETEEGIIFATPYTDGDAFIANLEKSTAEINDLPDSAFAYIEPGGKKDEGGKTIPRSLRHFPVHDHNHAQNALARANQSPFGSKAMPKILAAARRFGIKLDPSKYKKSDVVLDTVIKFLPFGDAPQNLFYGVVYAPDEIDTQGDFASADTIEKAAHDFLPNAVMNLHHSKDLQDVQVVESFIAPADYEINGQVVTKGSWILVSRVLNEELKDAILKGEISGYSLEGGAIRTEM